MPYDITHFPTLQDEQHEISKSTASNLDLSLSERTSQTVKFFHFPRHRASIHTLLGTHACTEECCGSPLWNRPQSTGSYTLEAVLVMPLVAAFLVMLLFFFRLMQVETAVASAMNYTGRKTAALAGSVEEEAALLLAAEGYFQTQMSDYSELSSYILNGRGGLLLWFTDWDEEYVSLQCSYVMKLPVQVFGFGKVPVTQRCRIHMWTGQEANIDTEYVYITESGSAYHASKDCISLNLSIQYVESAKIAGLRSRDGAIYRACPQCVVENSGQKWAYITEYGRYYHEDLECPSLKRTIYSVPIEDVGGRTACKLCWE